MRGISIRFYGKGPRKGTGVSDISSRTQEIAKMGEQRLFKRVDLGGVAVISTLNSIKIPKVHVGSTVMTWIHVGSTMDHRRLVDLAITGILF